MLSFAIQPRAKSPELVTYHNPLAALAECLEIEKEEIYAGAIQLVLECHLARNKRIRDYQFLPHTSRVYCD